MSARDPLYLYNLFQKKRHVHTHVVFAWHSGVYLTEKSESDLTTKLLQSTSLTYRHLFTRPSPASSYQVKALEKQLNDARTQVHGRATTIITIMTLHHRTETCTLSLRAIPPHSFNQSIVRASTRRMSLSLSSWKDNPLYGRLKI